MSAMQITNGDVVATVLGYPGVDRLWAADGDDAAFRFAYLLDLPGNTPEARQVLRRIISLVVHDAVVPHATRTGDLVDETGRIAAEACPADQDLRTRAGRGLGIAPPVGPEHGDDVAPVYTVCLRAVRFLFKAIVIARGDLDQA